MPEVYIGYIIFGVVIALFLTGAIVALTWGRKPKYPEGRKFEKSYKGFKATLIVDESVPYANGKFDVNGKLVSKNKLALACAASMYAVDKMAKKYDVFPGHNKKKTVKECIFYFIDDLGKINYKDVSGKYLAPNSNGFAIKVPNNMVGGGTYASYGRAEHMIKAAEYGSLIVHEYMHCYFGETSGNMDHAHNGWKIKVEGDKNIDALAKSLVAEIVKDVV